MICFPFVYCRLFFLLSLSPSHSSYRSVVYLAHRLQNTRWLFSMHVTFLFIFYRFIFLNATNIVAFEYSHRQDEVIRLWFFSSWLFISFFHIVCVFSTRFDHLTKRISLTLFPLYALQGLEYVFEAQKKQERRKKNYPRELNPTTSNKMPGR